jgi:NAD(P)-dependent dehydrogenase (short-subunit alcohol dehydrogenase family)
VFSYNRNRTAADQLVAELAAPGRRVECCQLSLEDAAAVAATIADVRGRHGRIHSVVYAAGPVTPINFVGQLTDEEWTRTFTHDTHACFHLVHAALPLLKEQKGGSITAVTTTQFARHVPMSVLSSAPKAAIESMLQVVAREYGRYGVRANSVRSGWLDGGKFADGIGGQVSDKARQAIIASIPLGVLGDPADVAGAVVFLSSREARYVTGEALSVDGGWKL